MIEYGSICSGIESATIAWHPLGMRPAWFSEIEKFPSDVLSYRWPNVANLGDMCNLPYLIDAGIISAPDILVGGTPCQSFSVAGARSGLNDKRGQLTLKYVELLNAIDRQRPDDECIAVWENVPGVLSSKDNAFGCFLGFISGEAVELQPPGGRWLNAGCVFGPSRAIAWRVLDAQHFGVAQRRRRVFVVASAREGFNPLAVLFESKGVRRDTAPCRKARKGTTATPQGGITSTVRGSFGDAIGALCARDYKGVGNQYVNEGKLIIEIPYRMRGFGDYSADDVSSTLKQRDYKDHTDLIKCFETGQNFSARMELAQAAGTHSVGKARRLTPVECERLQGFPDNHTRIPWRGKPANQCPDSPRYKAIGNSKAVPVIQWVGMRIMQHLAGVL